MKICNEKGECACQPGYIVAVPDRDRPEGVTIDLTVERLADSSYKPGHKHKLVTSKGYYDCSEVKDLMPPPDHF